MNTSNNEVGPSRFHGETLNGIKQGRGILYLANGICYCGDFKDDVMSGIGVLHIPNGDCYRGEMKDNLFHGSGTYVWADDSSLSGNFNEGKIEGNVVYKSGYRAMKKRDQFIFSVLELGIRFPYSFQEYIGQFADNLPNGWGEMRYLHTEYKGQFKNGSPDGWGEMNEFLNIEDIGGKITSIGEFEDGKIINGTRITIGGNSKNVYRGQFLNDQMHGFGSLEYYIDETLVKKYVGKFNSGNLTEDGFLLMKDGSLYRGQFKEDLMHGEGILINAAGISSKVNHTDGEKDNCYRTY